MSSDLRVAPDQRTVPRPRGGSAGAPLPARSAKGVVLRVVRSALADCWAPHEAAEELVSYVDGEVRLLEIARARIHSCVGPTATVVQARTLATLNVAINRVREQRGQR